jgi:hypothetical protein
MWIRVRATGQEIDMLQAPAELLVGSGKAVQIAAPRKVEAPPKRWPGPQPVFSRDWRVVLNDETQEPTLKVGPCRVCQANATFLTPDSAKNLSFETLTFKHCGNKVEHPPIEKFELFVRLIKAFFKTEAALAREGDVDPSPDRQFRPSGDRPAPVPFN